MDMQFSNAERAEVLTAALPYIKKYSGKIVVIKYGGNAMVNPQLKDGPTAGPAHPTPSPPAEGGGVLLCPRAPAVATVATAALGRGGGWGVRYPKAPSRIAREGVLTEGAPSLPRTVSPSGSRRRSTSRPASAGREWPYRST